MEIKQTKRFGEVFNPYGGNEAITRIVLRNPNHTPFTKRTGEVKAVGVLEFTRNPGQYLNIHAEEITTTKAGHTSTRVISLDLDQAMAERLVQFIQTGR